MVELSTRVCSVCHLPKSLEDFHRNATKPLGREYRCKPCVLNWKGKNHRRLWPKRRIYSSNYQKRIIKEGITAYGSKCACCGFDIVEKLIFGRRFLQIDHVNSRPREEPKNTFFVFWLARKQGYPSKYRLLCASCNVSMLPGETICEHCKWVRTQS